MYTRLAVGTGDAAATHSVVACAIGGRRYGWLPGMPDARRGARAMVDPSLEETIAAPTGAHASPTVDFLRCACLLSCGWGEGNPIASALAAFASSYGARVVSRDDASVTLDVRGAVEVHTLLRRMHHGSTVASVLRAKLIVHASVVVCAPGGATAVVSAGDWESFEGQLAPASRASAFSSSSAERVLCKAADAQAMAGIILASRPLSDSEWAKYSWALASRPLNRSAVMEFDDVREDDRDVWTRLEWGVSLLGVIAVLEEANKSCFWVGSHSELVSVMRIARDSEWCEANAELLRAYNDREWSSSRYMERVHPPYLVDEAKAAALAGRLDFSVIDVNAATRTFPHVFRGTPTKVVTTPDMPPPPTAGGYAEEGSTLLHFAMFYGAREVVRLLVRAGADVNAVNAAGRTPSELRRRIHGDTMPHFLRECVNACGAAAAEVAGVPQYGVVANSEFLPPRPPLAESSRAVPGVAPATPAAPGSGATALLLAGYADLRTYADTEFERGRVIGAGSFGTVQYAKMRGQEVAMKRLRRGPGVAAAIILREADVMRRVGTHENVLPLLGVVVVAPAAGAGGACDVELVTAFMARGSVREILDGDPTVPWAQRLHWAAASAAGIMHLHAEVRVAAVVGFISFVCIVRAVASKH